MPTPTYTALTTTVLEATTDIVDIGSIPADYRDLVLIIAGSPVTQFNITLRFNGDSSSAYWSQQMTARQTNGVSYYTAGVAESEMYIIQNLVANGQPFNVIAHIFDYSVTDKQKNVLSRASGTDNQEIGRAHV